MIDEVIKAFEEKNYQKAAQLVKILLKESPNHPWGKVYLGKLYEVSAKPEAAEKAEKVYREVLQEVTNPKIVAAARQGLQRLESNEQQRRQQALAQAKSNPQQQQLGMLFIEPINPEKKTEIAKTFARIMQLDPYTARMILPTRNWRLYRTGPLGELQVYVEELKANNIGAFCVSYPQIESIKVFNISYFQGVNPQGIVVCKNDKEQLGQINFAWAEVSQQVEALIPIFKPYAEIDLIRDQVSYKEQIQNYVHVWDLHLPGRRCILRLIDEHYDIHQGIRFTPPTTPQSNALNPTQTVGEIWARLTKFLSQKIPNINPYAQFLPFAESVINEEEALSALKPQLNLFRRTDSPWDSAFELYSRLVLIKNLPKP